MRECFGGNLDNDENCSLFFLCVYVDPIIISNQEAIYHIGKSQILYVNNSCCSVLF